MVEDNRWEFQASVWDAAQQQLQQCQQHSEANNEGGDEGTLGSSPLSLTDLPHPDCEEFVCSLTELPPPDCEDNIYSTNADAYT